MIPGKFSYSSASSVKEVLELLNKDSEDVFVLAGGQSLVSMMKVRLAAPKQLIDLNGIDELTGINVSGDQIEIGPMTRQVDIINSSELAAACPILIEAAKQIADPQVRNRGTVGGNAANGDPGNDMPALMQILNASFTLSKLDGSREVPAREYYQGAYDTAKEDDEILTKITIPKLPDGHGSSYIKQKRKTGDYATAAVGVVLAKDAGKLTKVSIGLTNLSDTPVLATDAMSELEGSDGSDSVIDSVATKVMDAANPSADGRGPVEFKKHLVKVLAKEAIAAAIANAK